MNRLALDRLNELPDGVERPDYDPRTLGIGVLHIGPGAFHRAHQAAVFDTLAARDPRWGLSVAALRTPDVIDAMATQDGLYSLTMLGREAETRVIGVHREWIRPGETERLTQRLRDPALCLVTSTVTEKGYCLDGAGELDLGHEDIRHDLTRTDAPRSLIGWITLGLALRRDAGLAPFAVLCCDNMTDNGRKLGRAVRALAAAWDAALAQWIADEVRFPNAMVDSITPATDPAHLARAQAALGMADLAAVQREPFTQWVLEDLPLPGAPDLAGCGVILTGDVAAFERAKLRLLNGTHSALAYLGSLMGHETVAEAMGDPVLARFVDAMARREIAPTLSETAELRPMDYVDDVFERYRNPGIRHLLSQIAWDGSQKLPYRLLSTAEERLGAGEASPLIAIAVAGWIAFVARAVRSGARLVDPQARALADAVSTSEGAQAMADAFLSMTAIFPPVLTQDAAWRAGVTRALGAMLEDQVAEVLRDAVA